MLWRTVNKAIVNIICELIDINPFLTSNATHKQKEVSNFQPKMSAKPRKVPKKEILITNENNRGRYKKRALEISQRQFKTNTL